MSELNQKKYWLKPASPTDNLSPVVKDYVDFMNEALSFGHRPYEESPMSCFGLGNPNERLIEFIFRGRGIMKQYLFEVLPIENKQVHRLGRYFGICEYACVVVAGIQGVREVSSTWLAGEKLEQVLHSTQFYDRTDLSEPLTLSSTVSD